MADKVGSRLEQMKNRSKRGPLTKPQPAKAAKPLAPAKPRVAGYQYHSRG